MTNFWRGFKVDGDEFLETKRGFCWERVPSQKTLTVVTNILPFEIYEEIVGPYFSGICQIYFPKKSHGQ